MITIQELLYTRGLPKEKTLLVRHKDHRADLYQMYRTDRESFILCQKQQGEKVFKDASQIVSFIGEEGTRSRFVGVYKVKDVKVYDTPQKSLVGNPHMVEYDLEEDTAFRELTDRIIVDWGLGTRAWIQGIHKDKEVLEIQPGLHYQHFKDYFDFIFTYSELKEIIYNQYTDLKKHFQQQMRFI